MNDRIVILIIDDIEVNRVILKGIFENDYDVIEAETTLPFAGETTSSPTFAPTIIPSLQAY